MASGWSVDARCRVVGGLWLLAAGILVWRVLPFLGVGAPVGGTVAVPLVGGEVGVALAMAGAIGVGKGMTVMRRAAGRARGRIEAAGARAGLGSVFGWRVVVLIGGMMALGWVLRVAPYPEAWRAWVVGVVYPGVALALVIGAVPLVRSHSER